MRPVLEAIALFLVKQIVTDDLVKAGEKALVDWLKSQVAKTDNKIDDYVVQVIAEALGVPV